FMRGRRREIEAARRLQRSLAWRERPEDRHEARGGMLRTANHQAVAALRAPDAATRADIEIVDATGRERRRAADVVFEMAVAAVDDGVALLQVFGNARDRLLGCIAGWHHQPDGARRREPRHEV